MFTPSERILKVQDPVIPIIGRLTAENPGTISLGQGVVHYGPPADIVEQIARSLESNQDVHKYGDVCGTEGLVEVISKKLRLENGIQAVPDLGTVIVTAGANMAFMNAIGAIADPGDEIILLSPYYFNHQMAIDILGCRTVAVPTLANHQPDLDALKDAISPQTRAIVTVSPNNPTGAVYSAQTLTAINALCAAHGFFHICDEAYEYFVYGQNSHFSPASISGALEHTISLYSLSKAYGMAGWRAGYMLVPNQLLMSVKKFQDTNLICPPKVVQTAIQAALKLGGDWCRQQAQPYDLVRQQIGTELKDCPAISSLPDPQGAFYFLLGLDLQLSSMQVCEQLIKRYRVAALPGNTFGDNQRCSIRISYGALDAASVLEGVGRLRTGLESIHQMEQKS